MPEEGGLTDFVLKEIFLTQEGKQELERKRQQKREADAQERVRFYNAAYAESSRLLRGPTSPSQSVTVSPALVPVSHGRRSDVPVFKTIYRMQQGGFGWSEVYYQNQPTSSLALFAASLLLPSRLAIMVNTCKITSYAVRQMGFPFAKKSKTVVPGSGQGQLAPLAAAGGEPPYSSLYLLARSTSDRTRQLHLSAVPTEIVNSDGVYTPQPAFTVALNSWIANVITAFQIGFQTYSAQRNITSLAIAGPTSQQVTVGYDGAPIVLAVNQLVQLLGVPAPKGVRKIIKVAIKSSDSPVTVGPFKHPLAGSWVGGGLFRVLDAFSSESLVEIVPIGGAKKSRGRPSNRPLGKRKAA